MNPQQCIQGKGVLFLIRSKRWWSLYWFRFDQQSPGRNILSTGNRLHRYGDLRILPGVDVEFGLSRRSSGAPSRLLYEMNQDSQGRWRINNITYLDESGFQIRSYLRKLLHPALWSASPLSAWDAFAIHWGMTSTTTCLNGSRVVYIWASASSMIARGVQP